MKVFAFTQTAIAPVVLYPATRAGAFAPAPARIVPHRTTLFSKEVMSDMDIMCIANAANLCSHYEQCDIEEREALVNRFDEQSDLLAERLATLQSLTKHLKAGDHLEVTDEEIAILKSKVVTSLGAVNANFEYLDGMEVRELQNEIHTAVTKDENKKVTPLDAILYNWYV